MDTQNTNNMKTIRSNAEQILRYYYEDVENKENTTIAEFCELESQSEPGFYRFLFNDEDISDFGSNLTDEEKEIAAEFFETL